MKYLYLLSIVVLIAGSIHQYLEKYDQGYQQGREDAENECIIDKTDATQVLIDIAVEDATYQCHQKIKVMREQCLYNCGVVI